MIDSDTGVDSMGNISDPKAEYIPDVKTGYGTDTGNVYRTIAKTCYSTVTEAEYRQILYGLLPQIKCGTLTLVMHDSKLIQVDVSVQEESADDTALHGRAGAPERFCRCWP